MDYLQKIDKSIGYYDKKYKELSNIIKGHSSWYNTCSEEQNLQARNAIIEFYFKYKECKPDKKTVQLQNVNTFHISCI